MVVMCSMKAETCDQEHRTYPATHVDGVPTTTTAADWHKNVILLSYIRVFTSIWSEKSMCFDWFY